MIAFAEALTLEISTAIQTDIQIAEPSICREQTDDARFVLEHSAIDFLEIVPRYTATSLPMPSLSFRWSAIKALFWHVERAFKWRWQRPFKADHLDDDALELIRLIDNRTRQRIKQNERYLGDLEIPRREFSRLAEACNHLVSVMGEHRFFEWIWSAAPGGAATLLVHGALFGYSAGDFWTAFSRQLGTCFTPRHQSMWGQRFRLFATVCSCPIEQDETGLRYVGAILRQAGLPTGCLFDLFDLINHSQTDPALRGKSGLDLIDTWRRSTTYWSRLDKPVCDFLEIRPKKAALWIESIIRLMGGGTTESAVPLRISSELERWRTHTPISTRSPRPPQLAYYGDRSPVLLMPSHPLPSESSEGVIELVIGVDATEPVRSSLFTQGGGGQVETAEHKFRVDPGESYQLQLMSQNAVLGSWELRGVQPPGILAFRACNAIALNLDERLPGEDVWFLLKHEVQIRRTNEREQPMEGPPLLGSWSQYRAELWSLDDMSHVIVEGPQGRSTLTVLQGAHQSPPLEGGMLIRDAFHDPQQNALYAESPDRVVLPKCMLDDPVTLILWRHCEGRIPLEVGRRSEVGATTDQDRDVPLSELGLISSTFGQFSLDIRSRYGIERTSFRVVPRLQWNWDPVKKAYIIDVANGLSVRPKSSERTNTILVDSSTELTRYHVEQVGNPTSNRLEIEIRSEKVDSESVSIILRMPQWTLFDQQQHLEDEVWQRLEPVVKTIEDLKQWSNPVLIVEKGDMFPVDVRVVSARLEIEGGRSADLPLPSYESDRILIRLGHQMDAITHDRTRNARVWLNWRTTVPNRVCVFVILGNKPPSAPTDLQKDILCTLGTVAVSIDSLVHDVEADFGAVVYAIETMPTKYSIWRDRNGLVSLEFFTYYRARVDFSVWGKKYRLDR